MLQFLLAHCHFGLSSNCCHEYVQGLVNNYELATADMHMLFNTSDSDMVLPLLEKAMAPTLLEQPP